jgi:two-component system response regulator LytT
MRFAVCDDDELTLRYISRHICEHLRANNLQIPVDIYRSPEPLLRLIGEKGANPYTVIFLDIGLGTSLGIDVARKIRSIDRKFILVFITGYPEYMETSFELHTYDYIRKPIDRPKLEKLMERLFIDLQPTPTVTFSSEHRTVTLKISDIMYIAGKRNGSLFVSKHGEYPTSIPLRDVAKLLKPPISRCHNGYYVNIRQAVDFSRRTLTMTDGKKIPVGRVYYKSFVRDYQLFR